MSPKRMHGSRSCRQSRVKAGATLSFICAYRQSCCSQNLRLQQGSTSKPVTWLEQATHALRKRPLWDFVSAFWLAAVELGADSHQHQKNKADGQNYKTVDGL